MDKWRYTKFFRYKRTKEGTEIEYDEFARDLHRQKIEQKKKSTPIIDFQFEGGKYNPT